MTRRSRSRSAASRRAASRSSRASDGESAVTASAFARPRISRASLATSVESTPPENATTTRPYPAMSAFTCSSLSCSARPSLWTEVVLSMTGNPPPAQNKVVIIEHHRLARRDGQLLFIELDAGRSVRKRGHRRHPTLMAGTDLRQGSNRTLRRRDGEPVHPLRRQHSLQECLLRADDQPVIRLVQRDDIHGPAHTDPQTLPLADGIAQQAPVGPEGVARKVRDRSRLIARPQLAPQEAVFVAVAHEADVLAIGLLRRRKIEQLRQEAHFGFPHPAQRKADL